MGSAGGILNPVVLIRRALAPLAVLWMPVVLLLRAPAPSAVLKLFPLVMLVSGVQVPPMVAPVRRMCRFPPARRWPALASAKTKAAAKEKQSRPVNRFIGFVEFLIFQASRVLSFASTQMPS